VQSFLHNKTQKAEKFNIHLIHREDDGCLNPANLSLLLSILDIWLGGYSTVPDFGSSSRKRLSAVFMALGYSFGTGVPLKPYSMGRATAIYEFKQLLEHLERALRFFHHTADVNEKKCLIRADGALKLGVVEAVLVRIKDECLTGDWSKMIQEFFS